MTSDSAENFAQHPYAPTGNSSSYDAAGKPLSDISAMFSVISNEKVLMRELLIQRVI